MANYIKGLNGGCCDDCTADNACTAKPVVGGPYTYAATAGTSMYFSGWGTNSPTSRAVTGTLPTGVTFNGTAISGIPTSAGTYVVSLEATNACGTDYGTLTITVSCATCTLSISLDAGTGTYNYDSTGVFACDRSYNIAITGAGPGTDCPNRIQFKADGTTLWDSTCIGGNASATVTIPAGTTTITVVWEHECGCPGCCDDNFVLIEGYCIN